MPIVGWRRVSSGSGCSFCAMLESRGAVYRRERSARFQAHDGCSCTAEPVWRREPDPPNVVELREEWERVTGHIPDRKGKVRAWNQYWRQKQRQQRIGMEGLRDLARERGIAGYSRMTKQQLIRELDLSNRQQQRMQLDRPVPRDTDVRRELESVTQYGLSKEDLGDVPVQVLVAWAERWRTLPDDRRLEEVGRWRQAIIDRQRTVAEALAEADELLANEASSRVLAQRGASRLKRIQPEVAGWPHEEQARALAAAMETGDPAAIRRATAAVARKLGLTRVGDEAGKVTRYDRTKHRPITGARFTDGDPVVIVRPGYDIRIGGERVTILRPVVEEATSAEAAALTRAPAPPAKPPAGLSAEGHRKVVDAIERATEVTGLSERARRHTADALRRELAEEQAQVLAPLLRALETGSDEAIQRAVSDVARAAGLRPIGTAGEITRLPSRDVEWVGAGRAPVVQVIRPGWRDASGRVVQRPAVQAATQEQVAAVSQARRGTLTMTEVSIQKAREELAGQLSDVERLTERGASARAVIATMRGRMRRLRLDPVDAAGNPLAGTSPTPAVRYVWRRPGGDVDMSGPRPTGWPPDELREWDLAKRMTDVALAVERTARAGRMGDVVEAARDAARM